MKVTNKLAPTLLVGLGGQGSKIVARVSQIANEEQKKFISFVVFDTDANELRDIRNYYPDVHTVQTSSRMTVGEYLYNDQNAKNHWFPNNNILNRKTPSEGAGQVRAISRLVMDSAIRSGDLAPLEEAIDDLYRLTSDESKQATRIVIISSIAGGTGSGLILPVSMYIKNYLVNKNNLCASVIRGFFLLPDVMYSVVKSESERANLGCNAYATIREIDAFMQKAYGTLDKRYQDLKFEVPKVGGGVEIFDEAPFDFCFMFSRDNIESEKILSKDDLLEQAAQCVYAQSIGPTNSRQNSSEDNTILERVKSRGRSNYCGAGASKLVYPYQDVKKYIAYNWAKDTVTKEWLKFDDEFRKMVQMYAKAKEEGVQFANMSQNQHYINAVETGNSVGDGFCKAIIRACTNYEDDVIEEGPKWEDYVDELIKYVAHEIETDSQITIALDEFEEEFNRMAPSRISELIEDDGDINAIKRNINAAYKKLMVLRQAAQMSASSKADSIAFTLFRAPKESVRALNHNQRFYLEHHLLDDDGKMIHPNAIRYFLYNLSNVLEKNIQLYKKQVEGARSDFETFDEDKFKVRDDHGTEISKDFMSFLEVNFKANEQGKIQKLLNRNKDDESDNEAIAAYIHSTFKQQQNVILEYAHFYARYAIFMDAKAYVDELAKSFELFYHTFAVDINKIEKGITNLSRKYQRDANSPTRFVCCDKRCLEALNNQAINIHGAFDIPSDLCIDIYEGIRYYALKRHNGDITIDNDAVSQDKDGKDYTSKYLQQMFDNVIMNFFENSVEETASSYIDLDIIEAIEKEIEIYEGELDKHERYIRIRQIIGDAKNLALPFIEAPKGFQLRVIDSCCYSPEIISNNLDDRRMLINEELNDFGGDASGVIPKYEIVFFRSIYNLKASDFRKFSPPINSDTIEKKAGNYFLAYYQRVNEIEPDTMSNNIVTPHLHKHWHLISSLPDLNEDYQKQLEEEITQALFYGFLFKKIEYTTKGRDGQKNVYQICLEQEEQAKLTTLMSKDNLPCSNIYEVLESLIFDPKTVSNLQKDCSNYLKQDERRRILFEDTYFKDDIDHFKLNQYHEDSISSIFELPVLYKYTCPVDLYFEGWTNRMISVIFKTLKEYIKKFENEDDFEVIYGNILTAQFKLLLENLVDLEQHNKLFSTIISDEIVRQIKITVCHELQKLSISEYRRNVDNLYDKAINEYKNRKKIKIKL